MTNVMDRLKTALSALGKHATGETSHDSGSATPEPLQPLNSGAADSAGASNSTQPQNSGARMRLTASQKIQFRPWDQSDLHARLETYRPLTWFAKPSAVNAIAAARHGWRNESVPYEHRAKLAERFALQLVTAHAAHCPWRKTQCQDKVLAYAPRADNELRRQFAGCVERLKQVDRLPDIDCAALERAAASSPLLAAALQQVLVAEDAAALANNSSTVAAASGARGVAGTSGAAASAVAASGEFTLTRLSAMQRARLLALAGWDLEAAPATGSTGVAGPAKAPALGGQGAGASHYSLQHLVGRKQDAPIGKVNAQTSILSCPCCHTKLGLWNFVGQGPLPVGRFSRGSVPSGGPQPPSSAATPATGSCQSGNGAVADRLNRTIAGGSFMCSAPRGAGFPVPVPPAASPFRFGTGSLLPPVFGRSAAVVPVKSHTPSAVSTPHTVAIGKRLAYEQPEAAKVAANPVPETTAEGAAGSGRAAKKARGGDEALPSSSVVAAAAMVEPLMSAPSPLNKRRATAEAVPAGANDTHDACTASKRARPTPGEGLGKSLFSLARNLAESAPLVGGLLAPVGREQPTPFDPLEHHRSWCPWVYTASGTLLAGQPESKRTKFTCGWQYLVQVLAKSRSLSIAAASGSDCSGAAADGAACSGSGSGHGPAAAKAAIAQALKRM